MYKALVILEIRNTYDLIYVLLHSIQVMPYKNHSVTIHFTTFINSRRTSCSVIMPAYNGRIAKD